MELRRLGRTGRDVGVIGFGAWAIGGSWGSLDDAQGLRALHAAADAGVTLFDTADVYGDGHSERLIGRFLRERPGEALFVATKMGRSVPLDMAEYTPAAFRSWVDRSRANLGVDRLDLVQLHCLPTPVYYRPDLFAALDDLVSDGAIAAYGVSVEKVEEGLKAIEFPRLSTVQIVFNAFRQRPAERFLAEAAARGVGVIARVPLASGLLSGKLGHDTTFDADDHRLFNRHGESFDVGETFAGVDYETGLAAVEELRPLVPPGATMAQLALRWILMQPGITCTIPGARTPEQAAANAAAADLPDLGARDPRAHRRGVRIAHRAPGASAVVSPAPTAIARVPGAILTEREHVVPLDHADPAGPSIVVFTREVADPDGLDRPYLLFLQGGPGFEATRPTSPPSGWIKRALRDYRVLLLDQRGTGRSSPVGERIPGDTPAEQAAYLAHFRADSIVRDAESIRRELGVDRWSVLGQSFGGFTSLTYLSIAPEGLREALITGGLAPIGRPVDDVYAATYRRLAEANGRYFARYPDDRARVRAIHRRLESEPFLLPSGDRLTVRRFRQLGLWLGDSAGFELLHHVLELPVDSPAFAHDAEAGVEFTRNPLYATLHESSYADGGATRWSAARLLPDEIASGEAFTAEHVFPWMFEDYGGLRAHRGAAELLAEHPWPRLYDADTLARNEVPVAATVYVDDLYIERAFAEETAAAVRGLRSWITNEYLHSALRADGERVLGRLIDLVRGRA